jgi:hypothetical protein
MSFEIVNILNLLNSVGEKEVCNAFSEFQCKVNPEIEHFLKNNAIDFARRKISVTHLIFNESAQLAAYFTLTHKSANISVSNLSKSTIKIISRYAIFDQDSNAFTISAFLIAQFGKNSAYAGSEKISGNLLMDYCLGILKNVQEQVGGGIAFLECENKKKLLSFYQNEHNRFHKYGERYSDTEQKQYIQLLKLF